MKQIPSFEQGANHIFHDANSIPFLSFPLDFANENGEISYIDRKYLATTSTFFPNEKRRKENTRDKMSTSSVYKVYKDRLPAILDRQRDGETLDVSRKLERRGGNGERRMFLARRKFCPNILYGRMAHTIDEVSGLGLEKILGSFHKKGSNPSFVEKREGD